jgi:tetratricopeptide (TPR) repeat protein
MEQSSVSSNGKSELATALVHEGWGHLQEQRPLAAWASWQRAMRVDPDSTVAKKALGTLESAGDLPAAARVSYRFREARDPARRAIWDQKMTGWNAEDLPAAADLFGKLVDEDPTDSAAWYNRALCLAWSGRNAESISCLSRVVELDAEPAFDRAVDAWTLAEVLRQGGGAETLADELRFACNIPWRTGDTSLLLEEFPEIQKLKAPLIPGESVANTPSIDVFEWLDRPFSIDPEQDRLAARLPMVLATVYISKNSLRLSSPRADALELAEEKLRRDPDVGSRSIERQASPLPFPFLDADVWIFRIPAGLDNDLGISLARESIEQYFENLWIHRPRHGLDDHTPLEAARRARQGDAVVRAKLAAVVRMREQLGDRPTARGLYHGYPFDRLRRRLGLELAEPSTVDALDLSCADPVELDSLDPATLDNVRLYEAAQSAAGLRDDARTTRFASELLGRARETIPAFDPVPIISPLVRQAMSRDDPRQALDWIDRAHRMSERLTATTLDIWRAEILARTGQPDAALVVYQRLIEPEDPEVALLSLDAAETMIDNGHLEQAEPLLKTARDLARRHARPMIERRAQRLLDQTS